MKQCIAIIVLLFSVQFCQGQEEETPYTYITTMQVINGYGNSNQIVDKEGYKALKLYNRTYTIKGLKQFDSKLVSKIDIDNYQHLYQESERVEIYDSSIGRMITLFAKDEITVDKEIWKKRGSLLIGVTGFEKSEKVK